MTRSVAALFALVTGLSAASALETMPLNLERQGVHNLLLKAAGARPPVAEPGKTRVPVVVDDVLYEVIVATPGSPRLFALAQ